MPKSRKERFLNGFNESSKPYKLFAYFTNSEYNQKQFLTDFYIQNKDSFWFEIHSYNRRKCKYNNSPFIESIKYDSQCEKMYHALLLFKYFLFTEDYPYETIGLNLNLNNELIEEDNMLIFCHINKINRYNLIGFLEFYYDLN